MHSRSFIENITPFLISLSGLIGSLIWAVNSNWDYEPVIAVIGFIITLLAFAIVHSIPNTTIHSASNASQSEIENYDLVKRTME